MRKLRGSARALVAMVGIATVLPATAAAAAGSTARTHSAGASSMSNIIPAPVFQHSDPAESFRIRPWTPITYDLFKPSSRQVANYLAGLLRPATGYPLPVVPAVVHPLPGINLELHGAPASVGPQGYTLSVRRGGVQIAANSTDGLFNGVQTLRQLLPAEVATHHRLHTPLRVAGGEITDYPRYAYRGAMLDVARHFFGVSTVEHYVDDLARYKVNYLHLHLTDDQGWRIQIDSWPNLTKHGAGSEVGGGPGGFYTKAQYRQIVRYAAARHITVIPEIDLPGHTNAALSSYAELNCDGVVLAR
ncbi:MAG: family 20 glycosylhydrolase [Sciscionella sp.]